MPHASGDLDEDAVVLGELGLLQGDEPGVGEHVDLRVLGGSAVGAGGDRLGDRLPVDHYPLRPVLPGELGDVPDLGRRDVGDLHAGDDLDVVLAQLHGLGDVGCDELHVRHVHVVGDGDDVVPEDHGPPHQLGGDELPVAEYGVGVKVGPHCALSHSLRYTSDIGRPVFSIATMVW